MTSNQNISGRSHRQTMGILILAQHTAIIRTSGLEPPVFLTHFLLLVKTASKASKNHDCYFLNV